MSSPPQKKKKIGPQLTLFGGIAAGNAVHSVASNSYERFVHAFVCRNLNEFPSKATAVSKAQEKWREIKADGKKIDQYIKEVELWKKARSSDASSWFVQPLHTGERVSTSSFTATQTAAEDVSVVPASRPSVIAHGDHALAAFIQELEVKSNELFTEDVLQQLVFMKEIKELARTYASFRSARDEYRSNISSGISHARKHSNVKDAIDKGAVLLTAVDKKLQEITSIQLNRSSLLSTQSQLSVQRKCVLVTEAVLQFPTVTKELLSLIRRLRVRNQQVAHRLRDDVTAKVLAEEKDILLRTVLGTSKSWHDCVAEAIEVESSADSKTGALTQRQLVSCVDHLQTSSVLPVTALGRN